MTNSTPGEVVSMKIAETSTIVSVKIELVAFSQSTAFKDIQEVRLFLYCRPSSLGSTSPIPDPTQTDTSGPEAAHVQVDTINGFYVGSVFPQGTPGSTVWQFDSMLVHEKFKFKRKCDRNTELVLSGDTIVRNGAAATVTIFGAIYAVLDVS